MRREPTWRIPIGLLILTAALLIYGAAIARWIAPLMATWPPLGQLPVYSVLGVIWLPPMRKCVTWMETGNWQ
jgi:Protein of unknown function (DUF2842)